MFAAPHSTQVLSLENNKNGQLRLLGDDYDTSESIGVAALASSAAGDANSNGRFVLLKKNGCLQLWSSKQKKILSRLHLKEQVIHTYAFHNKYRP
jgi:hypothetical protein